MSGSARAADGPAAIGHLIPRWPPAPDPSVEAQLIEVARSGLWGATQGTVVETLARQLAGMHGVPSATCCANGTIAIVLIRAMR